MPEGLAKEVKTKEIEALLDKYKRQPSQLISILHDIQAKYNWLPKETLIQISRSLGIPLSRAYSVASFYKVFKTTPRGRHLVRICLGTACHVRGGVRIMEKAEEVLGVNGGETTPDMKFTLERVNCLGCCALGPVMVVDGEYHGKIVPTKVEEILKNYD
jgi:NADH-quinone oxidoreductase subunit E